MKKNHRLLVVLAASAVWMTAGEATASEKKVTVCHRPPGNPASPQTIAVAEAATGAHLAHGDTLGACATGCQANPLACDDGNACTSDRCLADGQCAHTTVGCDDGNACTTDACHPVTGCFALPREGSCDDGDACTAGDSCAAGACRGTPVGECCTADWMCNDGSGCTLDSCVGNACRFEPRDCGVADACRAGFCDPVSGDCGSTPVRCDDGNICTDDLCDSASGCLFLPTSNPPEAAEVSCADALDNDCDGSVDSADDDCDACGTGSACTAADAEAFLAGLRSAVEAALPAAVCIPSTEFAGGMARTEPCNPYQCASGCLASLGAGGVTIEPATSADFRVRYRFGFTVTVPIRYELGGVARWCTLGVQGYDFEVQALGLRQLRNEGCALGAEALPIGPMRPTLLLGGCSEFFYLTGGAGIGDLLIDSIAFPLTQGISTTVDGYTAACPIQP